MVCRLAGQGIATRNVKPAAASKPSGRPWPSTPHQHRQAGRAHATTVYGAETNVQYLAETSSGGVALLDYDGDGWLDIFMVSRHPLRRRAARSYQPPLPQQSRRHLH